MKPLLENTCVSCAQKFTGRYCNHCGEKLVKRDEQTFKHFIGEVINAFTFADNKTWKTLKYLFSKPGVLPLKYIQGERKSYIAPLSLFLLINLLYFLFSPLDTFNSHFMSQLDAQPYSDLIHDYGIKKLNDSGLERLQFIAEYNSHSLNVSKSIILLMPLLFALPLWLLFYRRSSYYFDHLMFALSFMSFILLGIFFLLPLLVILIIYGLRFFDIPSSFNWNGDFAISILFGSLILYLSLALKNFYQQKILWIIIKTAGLLMSFVLLVFFYRFVLFFISLWTM